MYIADNESFAFSWSRFCIEMSSALLQELSALKGKSYDAENGTKHRLPYLF